MDVDASNPMTAFANLLLPLVEKAEAYNKSQNQTLANSMTMQLQHSQLRSQPDMNRGVAAAPVSDTNMALPMLPNHVQTQTSMATGYSPINGAAANYGANNNWMEHWDKWLDFQNDGSFPIDAPDYFFF